MRYISGYRCKGIVWFGMKRYARGERDPRASRANGPMEAARKGLTPKRPSSFPVLCHFCGTGWVGSEK